MSKYLGNVSAYAYAVEHGGYTGTEEEYGQEMADLANVSAEAETLSPESEATASYSGGVFSFGIPKGPGPTETQIRSAVDAWLADHPEATTTVDFSIATKVFNTVSAMQADLTLKANDNVCTKGYYEDGDNGGSNYQVSSTHSGVFYVELENGLYANRIDESGALKAEAIGIKAYSAETETPDQDDMDTNVLLANRAIYNGIRIVFGQGYFYFSDCIRLAHKGTYTLRGIDRNLSHLMFPSSDGLYFCDPIYYNYYVITGLNIHSYGHCIRCAEGCLTVLDSRFEWLYLTSDTGDCFHGPNYNVAKYTSQGGSTIYDTCVQNCVFDFVNASAPNGAAFCNIMGMYTYYQHMNFVSCKYGFRNCDGIVEQLNTLGESEEYFIYYDKANSYSLRWTFINVNAEGIGKAFIYTEPYVPAPPEEDPKKPETANVMALSRITAINSGWSLVGTAENHEIYPITVQAVNSIYLTDSEHIVSPSRYPNNYNTEIVKAHILALRAPGITHYLGGPDITVRDNTTGTIYARYGDNNSRPNITISNNGYYGSVAEQNVPTFNRLFSSLIFGGKNLDVWKIKCSEITGQPNAPDEKRFCDVVVFEVDTPSNKEIVTLLADQQSTYPGRVITVINDPSSINNLVLYGPNSNRNVSNYALTTKCYFNITLAPGEYIQLRTGYDTDPSNGSLKKTWYPLDSQYYDNDSARLYAMFKGLSSANIFDVVDGYYIQNNQTSVNINQPSQGLVSTGTYGTHYVLAECSPGDEFTIFNGRGGVNRARLWAFVKSDGTTLSLASPSAIADGLTITAPNNAAYLVVNSYWTPIVVKNN